MVKCKGNKKKKASVRGFWGMLWGVALGGIDGGNQHYTNARACRIQRLIFALGEIVRLIQKFQPISGFVGFFQSDLQFCNKIRFSVGILRFPNICADRRAASANLIGYDRFTPFLQRCDKVNDRYGEIHRLNRQFIISHFTHHRRMIV